MAWDSDTTQTITAGLTDIAAIRRRETQSKARIQELMGTLREVAGSVLDELDAEREYLKSLGQRRDAATLAVKEDALVAYEVDPFSKKPLPGLGIKVGKKLDYDPDTAMVFAAETGQYLSLDVKAFEKAMVDSAGKFEGEKTLRPSATLGFEVTVRQVPEATIASDLDAALA